MARRTEQKEQTRQRILASARVVFEAQGFEAASLREIARQAGVAIGTIFVHFHDKLDLLHAAFFEDLAEALSVILSQPTRDSLDEWLSHLTDGMLSYYESRPVLARVLLKQSLLADPPWAERFAAQIAEVHGAVIARAEIARSQGEIRDDANLPLFAAAYIAFYMFALIAWAQKAHPAPRDLVKHLTAQHLRALGTGITNP